MIKSILTGTFSAEDASLHFGISNRGTISQWLKVFLKKGIKGLQPKQKGHPTMKPKYAKMPPPPKTEEDRLHLRILKLEAEVAFLKKLDENQTGRSQRAETVESLRSHYPLELLLPIAKLARSTFFYYQHPKIDKDSELKAIIREIKRPPLWLSLSDGNVSRRQSQESTTFDARNGLANGGNRVNIALTKENREKSPQICCQETFVQPNPM